LHTPEALWSASEPKLLTFKSSRWRHYFANQSVMTWPARSTQYQAQEKSRVALARWLCKEWNDEHPPGQKLTHVWWYFFRHKLGQPQRVERVFMAGDDCLTASP